MILPVGSPIKIMAIYSILKLEKLTSKMYRPLRRAIYCNPFMFFKVDTDK